MSSINITSLNNKNEENLLVSRLMSPKKSIKKLAVESQNKNSKKLIFMQEQDSIFKFPNRPKNTIEFGLYYSLKYTFCFWRKSTKEKARIFRFLQNYLNERLDVIYYLRTLEILDRMKKILFNRHQNLSLDFLKTPNLYDQKELDSFDLDLNRNIDKKFNDLVLYYSQKIKNKELNEVDEKLLNMINPDIVCISKSI
jgi:hypothetical protein